MTTNSATVGTLPVPGASLHYEVRGHGPLLALHAAPMDADAFTPLADLLADEFTVLTSDPRGIHRSRVDDPDTDVSPDVRADDLAALLTRLDLGPARVLGSSGGAVSALSLAQRHPGLVHTVVAHEPPLAELLPDRDELLRETEAMVETYLSGDRVDAWRQFLASADIEMPPDVFEMVFAGPIEGRAAADERFSFAHMELPTTFWRPDLATLRNVPARLVVAVGADSTGEMCDRTSRALAAALDLTPTSFPGGHIGFAQDPAPFAARLREVLADG
jgi:pimeloyl-ACP methyl ester carboxylesterase